MLDDKQPIREALATFAGSVAAKLRSQHSCARMLTVFLETNPFRKDLPQRYPSRTIRLPMGTNLTPDIVHHALRLLDVIYKPGYPYKKAGVLVSELIPESEVQGLLYDALTPAERAKHRTLATVLDKLNTDAGRDMVRYGVQGFDRSAWWMRQTRLSKRYTTQWTELLLLRS
jgi:DNA polymerase V